MSSSRAARRAGLVAAGLALAAAAVFAQQAPAPPRPALTPPVIVNAPPGVLIQSMTVAPPGRGARGAEPLPPAFEQRFVRALDLRASGLTDRARDSLLVLLRVLPHHPLVVS